MDYRGYRFNKRETVITFARCIGLLAFLGWLFYQNVWGMLLTQCMLPVLIRWERQRKCAQRKWKMTLAFKDAMESLSAAMLAGYSVENGFIEANQDLGHLYPEGDEIRQEFAEIVAGFQRRIPVEEGLLSLARRSRIEEIETLAQVMMTGRKTGGNLPEMITATVRVIEERVEMKREIAQAMAEKRLEARIMGLVPLGMIVYLKICSPGFLTPLYNNLQGVLWMSAALAFYLVGWILCEHILQIEVAV
ncbi:MAG: type II secretion system F family protein [Lachnospiraceae bacterium]|nr:type II secretion system F family protein [Lachnospiraceae bacterium]